MSLLKRRTKPRDIDRRRSLAAVPVLHENVTVEERTVETVTLKLYSAPGSGFLDRFRPPPMARRYELDEFGTFVVRHMDREHTVHDIIKAFAPHFGMTLRESEMGVVAFIKMLMKRRMASVAVSSEEATPPREG